MARATIGGWRRVKSGCSLPDREEGGTTDPTLSVATHPARRPPVRPPLAAGSLLAAGDVTSLDRAGDRRCTSRRRSRGWSGAGAPSGPGDSRGRGRTRNQAGSRKDQEHMREMPPATDPLAVTAVVSAPPPACWPAVLLSAVMAGGRGGAKGRQSGDCRPVAEQVW